MPFVIIELRCALDLHSTNNNNIIIKLLSQFPGSGGDLTIFQVLERPALRDQVGAIESRNGGL